MKVVRVFQYPLEEQDKELRCALNGYGMVHAIQFKTIPGFTKISSLRSRLYLSQTFSGFCRGMSRASEHEGVVLQCIRCGGTAPLPNRSRHEQFGHEMCDAPCVVCYGNQVRSECRVKSFAAALTQWAVATTATYAPLASPQSRAWHSRAARGETASRRKTVAETA